MGRTLSHYPPLNDVELRSEQVVDLHGASYVDVGVLIDAGEDVDGPKAGGVQQRYEFVAVPLAHCQRVLLAPPVRRLGADRHVDAAVFLVDGVDAAAQRDLAVGRLVPVANVPAERLLLVVEDERAAGKELAFYADKAIQPELPARATSPEYSPK
ncbi:MAG: hypothetical protein H0X21_03720 [Actinobacteria bacterium]|nr:hypothetical protein [Actinomycetota bacterium]